MIKPHQCDLPGKVHDSRSRILALSFSWQLFLLHYIKKPAPMQKNLNQCPCRLLDKSCGAQQSGLSRKNSYHSLWIMDSSVFGTCRSGSTWNSPLQLHVHL